MGSDVCRCCNYASSRSVLELGKGIAPRFVQVLLLEEFLILCNVMAIPNHFHMGGEANSPEVT